jgi:hypothetical protein
VVVVGHIVKHEEGAAVVWGADTAAFAADMGLAHPETGGQEVGVESAVGPACMETVHCAVVRTEALRCFHKDVAAVPVSDVQ